VLRLAAHTARWSNLRRSKQVGSAIGDPRDAQRSCIVLHDPHLAVGAIQTDRALPKQQHRRHPSCQLAKEVPGFAKRLHRRRYSDRISRPICTLCLPIPPPDLGTPFSPKSSRFPYRKARSIKRCGNMQETINCKLNYLDQCFVDLLPGQRLAKDPAISLVPSTWSADD
jgi:hypothetical protein